MGGLVFKVSPEEYLNEDEREDWVAENAKLINIPPHKIRMFSPNNDIEGQDWQTLDLLQKGMMLDVNTINILYSLFCLADADGGNTIDEEEFYEFLSIPKSPFHDRMFRYFDQDGTNEIDFQEFVCAVWNIGTWETTKLPVFMFNLYDDDSSGYLELHECKQLIDDVFFNRKNKMFRDFLISTLKEISVPGIYADDWRIYLDSFSEWSQAYKASWQPIRALQQLIRGKILGPDWWALIGISSRKEMIENLVEFEREEVGSSGAKESLNRILEYQRQREIKEAKAKKQEKMWAQAAGKILEDESISSVGISLAGEYEDVMETMEMDIDEALPTLDVARAKIQKRIEKYTINATKRVEAINSLKNYRVENFNKWIKQHQKITSRPDPVSTMLRFEDRTLGQSLIDDFQNDWVDAKHDLENENYNRGDRLEKYKRRAGKEIKYFQRKSSTELPKTLRSKALVSVAKGKMNPKTARRKLKREQQAAIEKAGNDHLAKDMTLLDSDSESDTEESLEVEMDALAKRKAYKGQYKGQNHKRVPKRYRQQKINRDAKILRAKKANKSYKGYVYEKKNPNKGKTIKSQRHLRPSVKHCAVNMDN